MQSEEAWKEKIDEGLTLMTKNIKKLLDLSKKNNINIVIGVYPWPGQIIYENSGSAHIEYWKDFCDKHNIKFLNLFPVFIDYRKKGFSKNDIIKKFYIKNDVHFNRNGNQIIADEFLNSFF